MSAEVIIMCDICRKQIYRGDQPLQAFHSLESPAADAPRGTKTRVKRAEPAPGTDHGRVFIQGIGPKSPIYDAQTCSIECTKKAATEALDRIFAAFDPKIGNRESVSIAFTFATSDIRRRTSERST